MTQDKRSAALEALYKAEKASKEGSAFRDEAINAWHIICDNMQTLREALAPIEFNIERLKSDLHKSVPSQSEINQGYCPDDIEERVAFNSGIDAAFNILQGYLAKQEWTGLYDKNGEKIHVGDWLDFDEKEWGCNFAPEKVPPLHLWKGEWPLCGTPSDCMSFRSIIPEPPESE